jgi:hypothetical protein
VNTEQEALGDLVRDEARNLPLRVGPEERILAVMPHSEEPAPTDISAAVPLGDLQPVGHGL